MIGINRISKNNENIKNFSRREFIMYFYEKWENMSPESKIAVAALFKSAGIDIEKEILSLCERKSGEPVWIGLSAAARIANVSQYTVRRWCAGRLIEWRKLNKARCGRIIVKRASLIDFIDECKGKGA
jgi:hypothetical protein